MTCQATTNDPQKDSRDSLKNSSSIRNTVNVSRNDNCLKDEVSISCALHSDDMSKIEIENSLKITEAQRQEESLSQSHLIIDEFKHLDNFLTSKSYVKTDNALYRNDVIRQVNDPKLATNYSQLKDICTLLSSEMLENIGQKTASFSTNKTAGSIKRSRKSENRTVDSRRDYCEQNEKSLNVPSIVEKRKRTPTNYGKTKSMQTSPNPYSNKRKNLKKYGERKEKVIPKTPSLPPLLSLGRYDDASLSVHDSLSNEKYYKPNK